MADSNVLPARSAVTEDQFHNAMVLGLTRAQSALGSQKALAYVMDLSAKQVGNIMGGDGTSPKRLWDAHAAARDAGVLSDVAKLYGCKIVAHDAVCSTDGPMSAVTCALLKKAIDAELDGIETHQELLDMESELRQMQALVDSRLVRIAELRAPRVAA